MEDEPKLPGWAAFLAGLLLAGAVVGAGVRRDEPTLEDFDPRLARPDPLEIAPGGAVDPFAGRLPPAAPRDLRRLPGIGQTRAAALADTRWREAGRARDLPLSAVPGIGEKTERRVKAALAAPPGGVPP